MFMLFFLLTDVQAQSIVWEKSFGGTQSENLPQIKKCNNGYLVCGNSWSGNGDITGHRGLSDVWLARVDSSGNLLWQNTIGGSGTDVVMNLNATPDGGFIIAGATMSTDIVPSEPNVILGYYYLYDAWLIKIDSAGNLQWHKTYGGSGTDYFFDAKPTSDGGYIAAGFTNSTDYYINAIYGNSDVWVVKTDATGNVQWVKSIGGSADEWAHSLLQTDDGGYLIAGYTRSSNHDVSVLHGMMDAWIIKLSGNGAVQWEKTFGGLQDDEASEIRKTSDGNFVVVGNTMSSIGALTNKGAADILLFKIDPTGQLLWMNDYGGSGEDVGLSVIETDDTSGFFIAGYTSSKDGDVSFSHDTSYCDAWVIRTDNNGNKAWERAYGGMGKEMAYSMIEAGSDQFVFAAAATSDSCEVSFNHGDFDYWIVKIKSAALGIHNQRPIGSVDVYPTVVSLGVLNIDMPTAENALLYIYSANGELIGKKTLHERHNQVALNELPNGTYFLRFRQKNNVYHARVIVAK